MRLTDRIPSKKYDSSGQTRSTGSVNVVKYASHGHQICVSRSPNHKENFTCHSVKRRQRAQSFSPVFDY